MAVAGFLAWEEAQELRWEFDGFAPVAMTGGTATHEIVQPNLVAALNAKLRGTPRRAYGSNVKVRVAADRIRCPDAFAVRPPVNPRGTVRDDPVVFEVPGPGTARTERVEKTHERWEAPGIQRCVLIEQDAASATAFKRGEEGWSGRALWPGSLLALPEIGF